MAQETTRRSLWREYAEAILIAALFLRFANTFVVQTFYIPSGSMKDTLLIGDHLFVNRFIYGPEGELAKRLLPSRDVRRGDIVVFRSKEDPRIDMVKRCLGLPGDELRMVEKKLYINGQPVDDDSYASRRDPFVYRDVPAYKGNQRRRDNFGPFVVPAGHYFCLGDNRDDSNDSRFWGPLPAHLIKGRASIIYWSYGGPMAPEGKHTVMESLREYGRTARGFFTESRWSRTFHLVR